MVFSGSLQTQRRRDRVVVRLLSPPRPCSSQRAAGGFAPDAYTWSPAHPRPRPDANHEGRAPPRPRTIATC
eukprot:4230958-Pyramimonas_sp.AAC.1